MPPKKSKFWRFDNTAEPNGDFWYLDPTQIIGVNYYVQSGVPHYEVLLSKGGPYAVTQTDYDKLKHWAESQAEDIPEPDLAVEA